MNYPHGVTEVYNPATLEKVGEVANTDLSRIPEFFANARIAQKHWAALSFKQRKPHLLKMRDYIVDHAEELAEIVNKSNGKSRTDALITEVMPCALAADWYAKNAGKVLQPKKVSTSSILFLNKKSLIAHIPVGVVGIISPWNYPLSIPFGEVVMGLMAGNAIMLKVAATVPLVGEAIENIVAAGELPDGLFHHLVGSGGAISTAFFEHNIGKIFFTGSVPVGKQLMAQAAATLTPLSLELGGKDPMVVLADADLERAANGAAWAGYQNAGQSCGGVERIYVHESVYDEFVKLLAEKTKAMRHGVDRDFDVEMGSMTTQNQLKTVQKHVDSAVQSGAKIVAQSYAPNTEKGFFYPATLMIDVNHDMEMMQEETFGPVLPVMKFSTVEEAITLANDCTMALTSSVWTRNTQLGKEIALKIEAGVTAINDHLYTHALSETPWGGWKDSGLGRTHGAHGLAEMSHVKVVNWDILPGVKRDLWWFPFDKATYNAILTALRFAYPKSVGGYFSHGLKLMPFMLKKVFSVWKI
jgi:succinate-semialdehyde dehydrogenase/glutarate-semialdehyde dehydrogenase